MAFAERTRKQQTKKKRGERVEERKEGINFKWVKLRVSAYSFAKSTVVHTVDPYILPTMVPLLEAPFVPLADTGHSGGTLPTS
jgi:hypothetical protein